MISSVYFPLVFKESSISFILGSLLLQFYPKVRVKKKLIWDLVSNTVVIDERKTSTKKEKNKNEKNKASYSDNRVQSDGHLIKKGKLLLISVFTCLILIELNKINFLLMFLNSNNCQEKELLFSIY